MVSVLNSYLKGLQNGELLWNNLKFLTTKVILKTKVKIDIEPVQYFSKELVVTNKLNTLARNKKSVKIIILIFNNSLWQDSLITFP